MGIGVLGYISIVWHKEHSPEVWSVPSVTPCILELGFNYGETNKTIYTGHWVNAVTHLYTTIHIALLHKKYLKSEVKHNKHFTQNAIKNNKTNL